MHLVIGSAGYAGRSAIAALGAHFPVRGVELGDDLGAAMAGVDTVHLATDLHPPLRRLRWEARPDPTLVEIVRAARQAGARRLVHLSTAQVLGPAPRTVLLESNPPRPDHPYEKLHARDEHWLLLQRGIEVVILRPAQGFGLGEPISERLLSGLGDGRPLLVAGAPRRTFLAGSDLGRAFVAGALRGRPGHSYLLGGFASTWAELFKVAAVALKVPVRFAEASYDLLYLRTALREWRTPPGRVCWPNRYVVDVLGRGHLLEDGISRRELSWSPTIGSFDEGLGELIEGIRTRRLGERASGSPQRTDGENVPGREPT
ncbi:MAG: NAD-dependent epimerase/dehydratase family protein [Candidatus Dormibacteraeota bacterium]|nr:NAD-dependent epimerase/dehydratase family protein [Candidatus Dormibacteraeota bacterium]